MIRTYSDQEANRGPSAAVEEDRGMQISLLGVPKRFALSSYIRFLASLDLDS